VIEIRQGGLVFKWPARSRRLLVFSKDGRRLDEIAIGNVFDSRPAELDDAHEAVDEYCAELTKPS
jgi:hypothetical protein